MKMLSILMLVLWGSTSFAQDMSKQEMPETAYRTRADGTTVYVGKCRTHEHYEGKFFKVSEVIQPRLMSDDYTVENVKAIYGKIGATAFRFMMKAFFQNLTDLSTTNSIIHDFMDYADDITIERIRFYGKGEYDFLRFNVGYGGGNGGYLILLPKGNSYEKISLTNDADLEYCDLKVWK